MATATKELGLASDHYPPILTNFPPSAKIIAVTPAGISSWNTTYQIDISIPSPRAGSRASSASRIRSDSPMGVRDTKKTYWMKVNDTPLAQIIMKGEFANLNAIHNVMPGLTPRPHSCGPLMSKTSRQSGETMDGEQNARYFLLTEYINFTKATYSSNSPEPPEPEVLCQLLVKLHTTSLSPAGLFGYTIPTIQGRIPTYFGPMTATWTPYFTSMLKYMIEFDDRTNGVWPKLTQLTDRAITHLIPRLIGILESDHRSIKPSLLHGDLWEGNIGVEESTGRIVLFDPASLWGHSELEIGNLRCCYNKLGREEYRKTYKKLVDVDKPQEEWEDRNRLYCVYWNLSCSVSHLEKGIAVRQM